MRLVTEMHYRDSVCVWLVYGTSLYSSYFPMVHLSFLLWPIRITRANALYMTLISFAATISLSSRLTIPNAEETPHKTLNNTHFPRSSLSKSPRQTVIFFSSFMHYIQPCDTGA
ncbi:hypothetical protein F5051DRAFT_421045 [Lentinula edodes]|nr:hypothetical protein F5051DRAFT_421045 [Lentinula edodes]